MKYPSLSYCNGCISSYTVESVIEAMFVLSFWTYGSRLFEFLLTNFSLFFTLLFNASLLLQFLNFSKLRWQTESSMRTVEFYHFSCHLFNIDSCKGKTQQFSVIVFLFRMHYVDSVVCVWRDMCIFKWWLIVFVNATLRFIKFAYS